MKTKRQALFEAKIIVFASILTFLLPIFFGICMILTIIELFDPIKIDFIQKIHGEVGAIGLAVFLIVFLALTIFFFVISSLLLSGGIAYHRRMKRCSWKSNYIENFC